MIEVNSYCCRALLVSEFVMWSFAVVIGTVGAHSPLLAVVVAGWRWWFYRFCCIWFFDRRRKLLVCLRMSTGQCEHDSSTSDLQAFCSAEHTSLSRGLVGRMGGMDIRSLARSGRSCLGEHHSDACRPPKLSARDVMGGSIRFEIRDSLRFFLAAPGPCLQSRDNL